MAVLVPIDEWRRRTEPRLALKDLLLAAAPRFDLPPRRAWRRRGPPTF
jgi:hypothetical protein